MNKADVGIGLGLAGLMALCCGGPLLLVLAVPLLALLTESLDLIVFPALAIFLVLAAIGWYGARKSGGPARHGS